MSNEFILNIISTVNYRLHLVHEAAVTLAFNLGVT